jgi:hypothetical protein
LPTRSRMDRPPAVPRDRDRHEPVDRRPATASAGSAATRARRSSFTTSSDSWPAGPGFVLRAVAERLRRELELTAVVIEVESIRRQPCEPGGEDGGPSAGGPHALSDPGARRRAAPTEDRRGAPGRVDARGAPERSRASGTSQAAARRVHVVPVTARPPRQDTHSGAIARRPGFSLRRRSTTLGCGCPAWARRRAQSASGPSLR